jgi:hypothetical protein
LLKSVPLLNCWNPQFEYLSRRKEEIVDLPGWKQFYKEDPELFFTATQRMCSKKRKLEHESVPKFSFTQPASLTERAGQKL